MIFFAPKPPPLNSSCALTANLIFDQGKNQKSNSAQNVSHLNVVHAPIYQGTRVLNAEVAKMRWAGYGCSEVEAQFLEGCCNCAVPWRTQNHVRMITMHRLHRTKSQI